MIRKTFLAMVLTLMSSIAVAGSRYDGVWLSEGLGYFTINENNNVVVLVYLPIDGSQWLAATGKRKIDTTLLTLFENGVNYIIKMTMLSDSEFEAKLESCQPLSAETACMLADDFSFKGKKLF